MNSLATIKHYLNSLLELIKNFISGTIIELHFKHKATLETNRIIKINNSLIVFILLIVALVIYFK